MVKELVHVILKPDTLELRLESAVIHDLIVLGGSIVVRRRLNLTLQQVEIIYSNLESLRIRKHLFAYLISKPTEHLAFIGENLHEVLNKAKGHNGTGQGIRGKYAPPYTRLSDEDVINWQEGKLERTRDIDLERFGRNILHVASDAEASRCGLKAVLLPEQINLLRSFGQHL